MTTANTITSGMIPTLQNLDTRRGDLEPLAPATSLVTRKNNSINAAAILKAAVRPIAAIVVTVVTVVMVVINVFPLSPYLEDRYKGYINRQMSTY